MSETMDEKKYDIIVIDSAAFIKGAKIDNVGKEFYSIKEVMEEIKDKQSRGLLERFPYEIKLKEPSDESIMAVASFARLTGDLRHISKVDLKVMALTYELEVQKNGKDSVRTEPVDTSRYYRGTDVLRTVGVNVSNEICQYYNTEKGCSFGNACKNRHPNDVVPKKNVSKQSKPLAETELKTENAAESVTEESKPKSTFKGWNVPKVEPSKIDDNEFPSLDALAAQEEESTETKDVKQYVHDLFALSKEDIQKRKEEKQKEDTEVINEQIHSTMDEINEDDSTTSETNSNASKNTDSRIHVGSHMATTEYIDIDDNEGWASADNSNDGWGFSSSNEPKKEKKDDESLDEYKHVTCCTADYTMQNVLMQMGLRILSIDGKRIRSVKLWTYRCRACYAVCRDMTKLFCPACGNDTLARVPLYIDKRGRTTVGEINKPANLRGTIYSVPKNLRGANGLLLSEDQLQMGTWKQKMSLNKNTYGNTLGGMNEILTETFGTNKSQNSSNIVVGFGRKNPNAMKGRERRGKKQRNH
ncbi:hypothetical protein WA158_000375 [Blastocystis sp. Blastoise]